MNRRTSIVFAVLATWAVLPLLVGFARHLVRVWPQLTWNLDLLLPAVVAYLLANLLAHGLLHGSMARRGIRWRIDHTLALVAFIPAWFGTAFLVPGVLLQMRLLLEALAIPS